MMRRTIAILLSAALLVSMAAALGEETIGGDIGYYQVDADIEGAEVTFDNDFKGTTGADGTLLVDVYVTGTPYTSYMVEKQGYEIYNGEITEYPAAGETVQLPVELEPQLIGGDKGYYKVTTNGVAGADIYFGNDYMGVTEPDGTGMVEVYTTGTPYTTYKVEKPGYTTYNGQITEYPAKGETVQLSATLDQIPVTAPVTEPTPTQSPFPIAGIFGLVVLGAIVLSRKE